MEDAEATQGTFWKKDESLDVTGVPGRDFTDYLSENEATLIPDDKKTHLLNGLVKEYPYLFARGDLSLLGEKVISVVGTRNPSSEGTARAKQIAKVLVESRFVIMSGLAKGVDTAAHQTTLQHGGKTIAVLGTPIHKIYPAENKGLAEQIARQGLLLSASQSRSALRLRRVPTT